MIIYLTGSPASGKTTLAEQLVSRITNLVHFRFGRVLTDTINQNHNITQEQLRTSTAHISSPDIVNIVNEKAISICNENRENGNVIIDTHAVTTENNGFRITPMSIKQINRLDPDIFVCLTAKPSVRRARVATSAEGRPYLNEEQLRLQAQLQESLVVNYSSALGKPSYFMNNETKANLEAITTEILKLIGDY